MPWVSVNDGVVAETSAGGGGAGSPRVTSEGDDRWSIRRVSRGLYAPSLFRVLGGSASGDTVGESLP